MIFLAMSVAFANPIQSKSNFDSTLHSLLNTIKSNKDMKVFTLINHTEAAKERGKSMQNAVVIIFGNPSVGTDLMKQYPQLAIDLPMKILVYEENGKTYVLATDMDTVAKVHGIPLDSPFVKNTKALLDKLTNSVR